MISAFANTIALGSPVNRQSPLNRGLVAWWLCLPGLTGGLLFRDLCGIASGLRTGTTGLPNWEGAKGRRGGFGSLNLTAANSHYIPVGKTPDPFSIGANEFTLACWICPTTVSGYQIMIGRDSDASHRDFNFALGNTSGKLLYATGRSTNTMTPYESSAVIVAGEWQHVGVTKVGTAITFYRNGVTCGTGTDSETGIVSTTTSIGRRDYSGYPQYYGGSIDDIRIHIGTKGLPTPADIYAASVLGYPTEFNRVNRLAMFVGSGTAVIKGRRRRAA